MKNLTASQTVYLNEDRSKAVVESDKSAKYLLVKSGQEITEEQVAKYPGAKELIGAKAKAESESNAEPKREKVSSPNPFRK